MKKKTLIYEYNTQHNINIELTYLIQNRTHLHNPYAIQHPIKQKQNTRHEKKKLTKRKADLLDNSNNIIKYALLNFLISFGLLCVCVCKIK